MLTNCGRGICKHIKYLYQFTESAETFVQLVRAGCSNGFIFMNAGHYKVIGAACSRRSYSEYTSVIRTNQKTFPVIEDDVVVNRKSDQFLSNKGSWEKKVETYKQAVDISVSQHGVRHQRKTSVTDRVKALVDSYDDFLELSLIGGIGMEYGHIPRANVLTGIGKVMGIYCLVVVFDGSFKGGTAFPITLKKQLRAQEIALQNRLPCIYVVDSAGAFLPLQVDIFNPGGQAFYNEAVMSAGNIPQIAIVCGTSIAGGAYIPTMADEAVIVDKRGHIFLGGPSLVQAAVGEVVSAEDLGGAELHCRTSGCTDYFARDEREAFQVGRNIVASLNISFHDDLDNCGHDDPLYDIDDIPGLLPAGNVLQNINMYQVISRLVDGSRFHEFKALYGTLLLTGFAHVQGHLVGIIANQGEICEKEATKGAHFVQLCCERDIPLVFLQNAAANTEFSPEAKVNTSIIKCRARMLAAVSTAVVPKLTVIVGSSFGIDHYIMGGRAVSPNFLFAWPNAQAAIMEPHKIAESIIQQRNYVDDTKEALEKLTEKYEKESSAIYGATRILNDGIILPQETRKVLSECLAVCKAYRSRREQSDPVFRM